jgi:magnesium-transporting ATPase (P-type)
LYCNLICAVTLGFVTAVEPAELGIMNMPPRRVGKRLIGRFLALRIALCTAVLVATTVGAVFWVKSAGYNLDEQRAQALNTLTFGAVMVTLSARFSYASAIHPRLFQGNIFAWYAVGLVAALQTAITYIPGVNDVFFGMAPMDVTQWGIIVLFMFVTFLVMESEKALRRYLRDLGEDTDDREYDPNFDAAPDPRFGENESK